MIRSLRNLAAILGAAVLAIAIAGCGGAESSPWAGKYTTQDTQGQPMTIMLDTDGGATGERGGENLTGSWKEEGDGVAITWSDEWTTKIAKDGDKFTKTAFKDGSQDGDPVAAQKVE